MSTHQLMAAQNRLLEQQIEMLKSLQVAQREVVNAVMAEMSPTPEMMTERDLMLIVMAENVLAAVDRWNKSLGGCLR